MKIESENKESNNGWGIDSTDNKNNDNVWGSGDNSKSKCNK